MTHIGIIISVGSLRNEEKSVSQDMLEDCNTFQKNLSRLQVYIY